MAFGFAIDPVLRDLVIGTNGSFETVTHSGPAVILQLQSHLNKWWGDASAGSRLHDLNAFQRNPAVLVADEARRALGMLVDVGRIADVEVSATEDRSIGRSYVRTRFRDVSTGQRVDTLIPVGVI